MAGKQPEPAIGAKRESLTFVPGATRGDDSIVVEFKSPTKRWRQTYRCRLSQFGIRVKVVSTVTIEGKGPSYLPDKLFQDTINRVKDEFLTRYGRPVIPKIDRWEGRKDLD